MKREQLISYLALMMTALMGVACSTSTPSSSPSVAAASNTLTISPSTISVALGGSTTISVTGGTSPYTFTVVNGIGSIYPNSVNTAVYTAPASGATMAQVSVTDSAGNSSSSYVTIGSGTGTGTGLGLSVSPLAGTVTPGGTLQLYASGGTAPYYYIVTTANAGSFNSAGLYTAPATSQTVGVTVYDSVGASVQTTITVGGTGTGGITTCSGTYAWSAGGYHGSLTIVQDTSNGTIAGGMTWDGYAGTDYVTGTCSSNSITFTPAGNGQTWTGTLYSNSSNSSQVIWFGTISGASSTWQAVRQ